MASSLVHPRQLNYSMEVFESCRLLTELNFQGFPGYRAHWDGIEQCLQRDLMLCMKDQDSCGTNAGRFARSLTGVKKLHSLVGSMLFIRFHGCNLILINSNLI